GVAGERSLTVRAGPRIRVGSREHRVDLRRIVAGRHRRHELPGAPGAAADRVAVRLVADDVVELHLGAVDRLGVRHLHLHLDRVTEVERLARDGLYELDDRTRVADDDLRLGRSRTTGAV